MKHLLLLLLCLLLILTLSSHLFHPTIPTQSALVGDTLQAHRIQGTPSLSATTIDLILCQARSPACHTGQALYARGKDAGIDPIWALAFFWHESTFGRYGVAAVNKGLGNIRCTPGYACRSGYRAYQTWEDGYTDWYQLITWYITVLHKSTIETIVPTYAPPSENDTPGYIHALLSSVSTWRDEKPS
jgi:hypothetical protein